jgi:GxxExxY protein
LITPITDLITGCAIKVHRRLGPGLLESAYQACLAFELKQAGCSITEKLRLPLKYNGVHLDCGYELDLLVNDLVIVELKSVSELAPIHTAQVLTYLKLSGYPAALPINFNVPLVKQGIRRLLNPTPRPQFEISKKS